MEKTQPQNLWCEQIKKSHKNRAFRINFIKPQKKLFFYLNRHNISCVTASIEACRVLKCEGGLGAFERRPNQQNWCSSAIKPSHRATAVSPSNPNIRRTTKHQATNSPNIFYLISFKFAILPKNFSPWGFSSPPKRTCMANPLLCHAKPSSSSLEKSPPPLPNQRLEEEEQAKPPSSPPFPLYPLPPLPLTPHGYTSP